MYLKTKTDSSMKTFLEKFSEADAIVIGAGAGLSTVAGFTYAKERFARYFSDFEHKYGFHDMYSGGFYPYRSPEEHWAYWSRYIYINRYMDAPNPTYRILFDLVKDKNYFVITTNVDHQFQKAGFDKNRLFYTQGDYGLFQCSTPCHEQTYDNEMIIQKMVEAQGYTITEDKELVLPEGTMPKMSVPSSLVPHCPRCGKWMSMNLRADRTFVEDEGWNEAAQRYDAFLKQHRNSRIVFIELGVGMNTPGIIKYPFWRMTAQNPGSFYTCVNAGEAFCPEEIADRSLCPNKDCLLYTSPSPRD